MSILAVRWAGVARCSRMLLTSKRFLNERVAPSVKYVVEAVERTVEGEQRSVQVRTTIEDFRNPEDGD